MGYIISIGGQKGGTGKSTVAQGCAVEAARGGASVLLLDMDLNQRSSLRWSELRKEAGLEPVIEARPLVNVEGIEPLRGLRDVIIVDAPGFADVNTLKLARASDLLVITSGTSWLDLEPTVGLLHALRKEGVPEHRAVVALVKVLDDGREQSARDYLKAAGYSALPTPLRFFKTSHDIAQTGQAITEASRLQKAVAVQGESFFLGIVTALEKSAREERRAARGDVKQPKQATKERAGR